MSFASWPYDRSTTNPINTLSGRIARPPADEPPPGAYDHLLAATPHDDDRPEVYERSMVGLVRAARGTS
jgi:hypothetical protein